MCIIGTGRRADSEMIAVERSGAVRVVGVWNRTPETAQAFASRWDTRAFSSVRELVQETRPDIVNVVTHPRMRLPVMREAVEAGARAFLIEKPIALSRAELTAITELSDQLFVAVNTQYQWMRHWRRLLQLVADGALGTIRAIRVSNGVDILEQGPHNLSLALAIARAAGLPGPEWVLAGAAGTKVFGEVTIPADTVAVVGFGDIRLEILAGECAPRVPGETNVLYQQQIEAVGSRGRIWVSLNQGWECWREGEFESGPTSWPEDDFQSQADLFTGLRDAIVDPSLRDVFPTRIEQSAQEAEILFACIESAATGTRIQLG